MPCISGRHTIAGAKFSVPHQTGAREPCRAFVGYGWVARQTIQAILNTSQHYDTLQMPNNNMRTTSCTTLPKHATCFSTYLTPETSDGESFLSGILIGDSTTIEHPRLSQQGCNSLRHRCKASRYQHLVSCVLRGNRGNPPTAAKPWPKIPSLWRGLTINVGHLSQNKRMTDLSLEMLWFRDVFPATVVERCLLLLLLFASPKQMHRVQIWSPGWVQSIWSSAGSVTSAAPAKVSISATWRRSNGGIPLSQSVSLYGYRFTMSCTVAWYIVVRIRLVNNPRIEERHQGCVCLQLDGLHKLGTRSLQLKTSLWPCKAIEGAVRKSECLLYLMRIKWIKNQHHCMKTSTPVYLADPPLYSLCTPEMSLYNHACHSYSMIKKHEYIRINQCCQFCDPSFILWWLLAQVCHEFPLLIISHKNG